MKGGRKEVKESFKRSGGELVSEEGFFRGFIRLHFDKQTE